MNTKSPKIGVVLLAHGSRDPLWHKPVIEVAQKLRAANPLLPVECAYIELSTPDLTAAVQNLMAKGVQQIRVLPLFLGVGRHAREDMPRLVNDLQAQYPQVEFELRPAVGEDHRIINLLVQLALEGVSH